MSENVEYNELNQDQGKGPKLSVLSELNGASIGVGIALICIIIASVVFYIFMNLSPKKTVKVVDDADLFTSEEMDNIEDAAKKLSKEKDINVVIVTTKDKGKGYSNSDDDEKRFAEDYYMKSVKTVPLQNNSGVCILIDVTLDYKGGRFFWLYTYGTAHFAVDDDECYQSVQKISLRARKQVSTVLPLKGITKDLNKLLVSELCRYCFLYDHHPYRIFLPLTGHCNTEKKTRQASCYRHIFHSRQQYRREE